MHPINDLDWTVPQFRNRWEGEQMERLFTNERIQKMLQSGNNVRFQASGLSLMPLVHPGDVCMYEPVCDVNTIKLGDVVFCWVRGHGRWMAQHVLALTRASVAGHDVRYFEIGYCRAVGEKIVGFCKIEDICGRLVEVVGRSR